MNKQRSTSSLSTTFHPLNKLDNENKTEDSIDDRIKIIPNTLHLSGEVLPQTIVTNDDVNESNIQKMYKISANTNNNSNKKPQARSNMSLLSTIGFKSISQQKDNPNNNTNSDNREMFINEHENIPARNRGFSFNALEEFESKSIPKTSHFGHVNNNLAKTYQDHTKLSTSYNGQGMINRKSSESRRSKNSNKSLQNMLNVKNFKNTPNFVKDASRVNNTGNYGISNSSSSSSSSNSSINSKNHLNRRQEVTIHRSTPQLRTNNINLASKPNRNEEHKINNLATGGSNSTFGHSNGSQLSHLYSKIFHRNNNTEVKIPQQITATDDAITNAFSKFLHYPHYTRHNTTTRVMNSGNGVAGNVFDGVNSAANYSKKGTSTALQGILTQNESLTDNDIAYIQDLIRILPSLETNYMHFTVDEKERLRQNVWYVFSNVCFSLFKNRRIWDLPIKVEDLNKILLFYIRVSAYIYNSSPTYLTSSIDTSGTGTGVNSSTNNNTNTSYKHLTSTASNSNIVGKNGKHSNPLSSSASLLSPSVSPIPYSSSPNSLNHMSHGGFNLKKNIMDNNNSNSSTAISAEIRRHGPHYSGDAIKNINKGSVGTSSGNGTNSANTSSSSLPLHKNGISNSNNNTTNTTSPDKSLTRLLLDKLDELFSTALYILENQIVFNYKDETAINNAIKRLCIIWLTFYQNVYTDVLTLTIPFNGFFASNHKKNLTMSRILLKSFRDLIVLPYYENFSRSNEGASKEFLRYLIEQEENNSISQEEKMLLLQCFGILKSIETNDANQKIINELLIGIRMSILQ
ncbi:uncharacterized protein SCODWIG_00419 [Saccharomycodes ludwigii]|uniref:Uncharacterized protein n=1 Tax=Saccharomycodes ludwigii TaxID=36035 RepID=A0A376B1U7_9ASCO|nr:uncharacterized protein SCODWIG_00419 [Saccharomycodes ludwigii]